MNIANNNSGATELKQQIMEFIESSKGLSATSASASGQIQISQRVDGKSMFMEVDSVQEVIQRVDADGQGFLQVNFLDGRKILLTAELVGFKPAQCPGLDMDKLPRVVTTPDLISVIEAIEETMHSDETHPVEIDVLRRVFSSVLQGGEDAGFNLSSEKAWIQRVIKVSVKASA